MRTLPRQNVDCLAAGTRRADRSRRNSLRAPEPGRASGRRAAARRAQPRQRTAATLEVARFSGTIWSSGVGIRTPISGTKIRCPAIRRRRRNGAQPTSSRRERNPPAPAAPRMGLLCVRSRVPRRERPPGVVALRAKRPHGRSGRLDPVLPVERLRRRRRGTFASASGQRNRWRDGRGWPT